VTGTAAVGANGLLYVVGGADTNGVTNLVHVYDPASDAWSTQPRQMQISRLPGAIVAVVLGAD